MGLFDKIKSLFRKKEAEQAAAGKALERLLR